MRLLLPILALAACPDQTLSTFNAEPEAEILSPSSGDKVIEGDVLELRGQVSDADDDAGRLSATWYAGQAQLCPPTAPDADGLSACFWTADLSGDDLRLEVIDPGGAAASASVEPEVIPNTAPVVAMLAPSADLRYYTGSLVTFDATTSDAEDPISALVVAWTSSIDGVLALPTTVDDDGHARGATSLSEGEHYLQLEVADGHGKSGIATGVIRVGPPNNPPTCQITAPNAGEVSREGESLLLAGSASDADVTPEALTAEWASDRDGALGSVRPDSTGNFTLAVNTLTPGLHTLSLTVVDDAAATCVASVTHSVLGAPRIVVLTPVDADVVTEGAALAFEAMVSDVEDPPDALILSFSSDLDGEFWTGNADATGDVAFTYTALSVGWHSLTLSAVDSDGLMTEERVTVLVNALPSAPVVQLSPNPAGTDNDLTASLSVASVDPDSDPIAYTWAWYVGGVLSSASTSSTLPASATRKGETWAVVVTPNDGYASGPSGSATLVISNTAPALTGISVSPSSPTTDETLSASASTSDADGDAVSLKYAWRVNGALTGTSATLSGTYFGKGDIVTVSLTPNDGEVDGAAATSGEVVVQNSAPGAASVVLLPTDPAEGVDDLVCEVSASDADNDVLSWTFEWTRDGSAWSGATTTTTHAEDTIPATATADGEVWACTASPDDGEATGASDSSSVTVTACPYGAAAACPGASCDEILAAGYSVGDGVYHIDPDGTGAVSVYCDMTTDGGGWTLVAVASDDGVNTWTYAKRRYWDVDTTTFGSISALNRDYKSASLHTLLFADVLLAHMPSGSWAEYDAVGDGSTTLAALIAGYGDEECWKSTDGYLMTAGGITASSGLCSTNMTFNAADHDGGGGSCTCANCTSHTYGPSFSTHNGDGCPFDDPGAAGGLGPDSDSTDESDSLGFGAALGLNTGASGAAENFVRVFVR